MNKCIDNKKNKLMNNLLKKLIVLSRQYLCWDIQVDNDN